MQHQSVYTVQTHFRLPPVTYTTSVQAFCANITFSVYVYALCATCIGRILISFLIHNKITSAFVSSGNKLSALRSVTLVFYSASEVVRKFNIAKH